MSRPTKEEAKGWALLTANHIENGSRPTEAELCALRNWLASVARVLPTAAAVQRDCERRKPTLGPVPSEWLPHPDDVPGRNDGYPE